MNYPHPSISATQLLSMYNCSTITGAESILLPLHFTVNETSIVDTDYSEYIYTIGTPGPGDKFYEGDNDNHSALLKIIFFEGIVTKVYFATWCNACYGNLLAQYEKVGFIQTLEDAYDNVKQKYFTSEEFLDTEITFVEQGTPNGTLYQISIDRALK